MSIESYQCGCVGCGEIFISDNKRDVTCPRCATQVVQNLRAEIKRLREAGQLLLDCEADRRFHREEYEGTHGMCPHIYFGPQKERYERAVRAMSEALRKEEGDAEQLEH